MERFDARVVGPWSGRARVPARREQVCVVD